MDQHTDHSTNQSAEDESIHSSSASTVLRRAFVSIRSFTSSLWRTHQLFTRTLHLQSPNPYSEVRTVLDHIGRSNIGLTFYALDAPG